MDNLDKLFKAYECGIDYGLLIAEQERDSEDMFDAVGCYVHSRKMCVPSNPARRRQPRSEKWRQAKAANMIGFIKLCGGDMNGS
jgi:hypothetical protein